jgi:hypothetical protein
MLMSIARGAAAAAALPGEMIFPYHIVYDFFSQNF